MSIADAYDFPVCAIFINKIYLIIFPFIDPYRINSIDIFA